MTENRSISYRGHTILRDHFRYRIITMQSEDSRNDTYFVPSFTTLKAAKACIDRRIADYH